MGKRAQVKAYPPPPPLFPLAAAPTCALDMIPETKDPTGRGEKAWQIMRRLPITEGEHAGKRIGDTAPPWMPRLTKLIFGHTDEAGRRILREAFVALGKKNAKTTYASAVGMTSLLLEEEQRAFVAMLAENRPQARIAFENMVHMVRADEELGERFEIVDHRHTLRYPRTGSKATAIAADMASLVGFNPSLGIVDELHLLGATPKGAALVNQIRTGSVARKEPLLCSFSTAPTDRSAGIFESTMAKARRVIAGEEIDPRFFAWLCLIPEGLDPEDAENWHWSNPSLGYTITLDRLKENRESAKSDPEALRTFNSQNLNILPDSSTAEGKWMAPAIWDEAGDDTLSLEAVIEECERIAIGTDAGGLDDPSAIAVLGETADGQHLLWVAQWLSRQGYVKRKTVNPYDKFIDAGELTVFDGGDADVLGFGEIAKTVAASGKLAGIGIDSYGASDVSAAVGGHGAEVVAVPQSWKLTPAITFYERRLAAGTLRHCGSAILSWNVGNAVVERRGNAKSISKATIVGPGKIDGLAAALTAAAVLLDPSIAPRVDVMAMIA